VTTMTTTNFWLGPHNIPFRVGDINHINPAPGNLSMLRRRRVVVKHICESLLKLLHPSFFAYNTVHNTNAIACHFDGILKQFPHEQFYWLTWQNMLINDLKIANSTSAIWIYQLTIQKHPVALYLLSLLL